MQFARDHPGVTVVGVGAGTTANGDSLDSARTFVTNYGADTADMTMIYDVSYRSWRNFGVTNQPWVILFDRNGDIIYNAPGRVDLESAATALGV